MSDPRSPFSPDPLTERVTWAPANPAPPTYAATATAAVTSAPRRPVRLGLVVGAVLAAALVGSLVTFVIVRASDPGPAPAPAAAIAPTPTASSSAAPAGGYIGPRESGAPNAPAGGQPATRGWLGIHVVMLDPAIAKANNLPVDSGAWITASTTGSGQGSTGGAAASQDPNAQSGPGTEADGGGGQGSDPNAQSSPGTDADGEGQVPTGQAPAAGAAQAADAVIAGSPADKAGLQAGDIITAVDGTALDATHPLGKVMSRYAPGTTVSLDVLRNGQHTTVSVTLGTRPANG